MKATTSNNAGQQSWLAQSRKSLTRLLAAGTLLAGAMTAAAQPTVPPATPTLPAANVDSLYNSSGTHNNLSGINYYEDWGGWASAGDYSIPPTVLGYQGVNYGGIDLNAPYDFSSYVYLHVDLYTPNGSSFAVRLVDNSAQQADVTYTTAGGVIVPNTWVHLDLPLSQFKAANPALDLTTIHQLGLINNNPGETPPADYYLDNLYFYFPTNTPVNVAITSPADGATLGGFFSITASAAVYPGTVTNVNFYDGGALLGNAAASPFSYSTAGLGAGGHALTAVATDSGGNMATSSVVNVTVTNAVVGAYESFNYPLGTLANGARQHGQRFHGQLVPERNGHHHRRRDVSQPADGEQCLPAIAGRAARL